MKVSIEFKHNVARSWHEVTEECSACFENIFELTEEQYEHFCERYLEYRLMNGGLFFDEGNVAKTLYEVEQRISELKQQLADMDYKTSKYLDGEYTEEQWNDIVLKRKSIRREIRELELLL